VKESEAATQGWDAAPEGCEEKILFSRLENAVHQEIIAE